MVQSAGHVKPCRALKLHFGGHEGVTQAGVAKQAGKAATKQGVAMINGRVGWGIASNRWVKPGN